MKVVVIAAASRGLRRTATEHLSRVGSSMVGTYNTAKEQANAVAACIRQAGVARSPSSR